MRIESRRISAFEIVIATRDRRVRYRVRDCLAKLNLPFHLTEPFAAGRADTVSFLSSSDLAANTSPLRRAVIVLTGAKVTDEAVALAVQSGCVALRYEDVTPKNLLRTLLQATARIQLGGLVAHLRSHPRLRPLPEQLMWTFALDPGRMVSTRDICRTLRITPRSARRLLKKARFDRAEHLFATLRGLAWEWFSRSGVNRAVYEEYLGIVDRSNFRRSCERAGIPVPWEISRRRLSSRR